MVNGYTTRSLCQHFENECCVDASGAPATREVIFLGFVTAVLEAGLLGLLQLTWRVELDSLGGSTASLKLPTTLRVSGRPSLSRIVTSLPFLLACSLGGEWVAKGRVPVSPFLCWPANLDNRGNSRG